MPTLPIPLIGALILAFLFVRMWTSERDTWPLAGLLGLCAAQAFIISLAQHYGVPGMARIQPITATLIPPVAWLAFQVTANRNVKAVDTLHLAGPFLAIFALATMPVALDALIPALFLAYGGTILFKSTIDRNRLLNANFEAGVRPARLWQIIGLALMASALSDVLIVAAQIGGMPHLKPWIISLYSVGNLILIGGLSLSRDLSSPAPEMTPATQADIAADADLLARLDRLMKEDKPFLDPDLTLARLARRLHLPAKQLSAAINRQTGENVSRYINKARIEAAQSALRGGVSVTQAMLSSGFQTKSNFNREFLRISGMAPTKWRDANVDNTA